MIVSMIAAVASNGVIGKDNDLIWDLPKDMKFFMDTTRGHHVIMGRRNYDSIPEKYRPLKGRANVIVTRQVGLDLEGCDVVNSIEEGIRIAKESGESECFIIGGGQIYKKALELGVVDKMYLTHIEDSFDGDTFFPEFDTQNWSTETIMSHLKDETNPHSFEVLAYSKN